MRASEGWFTLLRRAAGHGGGFRASQGFTLIELLVVIVIIGILASLTVVGVVAAMRSSRISSTEAMVLTVKGALESYRVRWSDYPPSTLGEFRVALPNDVNNGAESLTGCLSSSDRGGVLYQPPSLEEGYGNVDGDRASRNLCNWYFGDNQLREILDLFQRPLIYLHHKDYTRMPAGVKKYRLKAGGQEVEIKPVRVDATKTFASPDKFQLFSAGGDGVPGTADDIAAW